MLRIIAAVMLLPFAGQSQTSQPQACRFTAAQLGQALGAQVSEGKPGLSMPLGGATLQDCRYQVKSGKAGFTLMLKTTVYTRSVTPAQHFESLAGRLVAVPNDPDGARWQEGQGDLTSPALHYFRKGTGVELRILGTYYEGMKATEAEFKAWQKKLAALPRVP